MMNIILEAAEEQIRLEESLKFKNNRMEYIAEYEQKVDALINIGEIESDNEFYDI